jgi:capsular polysaccharide biosynthesis protein
MPKNITIQKILGILLHRLPMILMAGVLGGLVFFVYTSFAIKPVYSTSAMIYIQNYGKQSDQNATDDKQAATAGAGSSESLQSNNAVAQKIFNSDLAGSAALASNCITLFNNSNDITRYYDGCSVSMSTAEDTFYITIEVSGNDPVKCANVANIVAEKCAPVFHSHFPYGRIGTIREAGTPSSPISPNKVQNTLIGVVVGIILACVVAIVMELIDTTIKSDDDLSALYKVPVFAEIPDFENTSR